MNHSGHCCPRHVTRIPRTHDRKLAPLAIRRSVLFSQHGRRCAEKTCSFPVSTVGENPRSLERQAFGLVQNGIHIFSRFSFVVSWNRNQFLGDTESSMWVTTRLASMLLCLPFFWMYQNANKLALATHWHAATPVKENKRLLLLVKVTLLNTLKKKQY